MFDDWLLGVAFCKMNHFFSHVSYFSIFLDCLITIVKKCILSHALTTIFYIKVRFPANIDSSGYGNDRIEKLNFLLFFKILFVYKENLQKFKSTKNISKINYLN